MAGPSRVNITTTPECHDLEADSFKVAAHMVSFSAYQGWDWKWIYKMRQREKILVERMQDGGIKCVSSLDKATISVLDFFPWQQGEIIQEYVFLKIIYRDFNNFPLFISFIQLT